MSPLILHFVLLLAVAHTKDYCSVCIDHTMCRFGDKTGRRCGKNSEGGVTDLEIQTILNLHNGYRSKVSAGKETQGTPGPQPTAANMQALVWDEKLAEVAQRWADQCTFEHDKCRNDPRFPVGQNIYYSSGLEVKNWTRAVESWYQEVKRVNASQVEKYDHQHDTIHYAQLTWAKSRYIGCARRSYPGLYRPRASPPLEYVLGEARSRDDDSHRVKAGYLFGADIRKIDLAAGVKGAITPKSSVINYAAADQSTENSQQTRHEQQPGFFGGSIFDPNAAQAAMYYIYISPASGKQVSVPKPTASNVNVLVKPAYVFNYNTRPQLSIPSIAYPVYKPYYPTYSQYFSYENRFANLKHTTESSKDSSEEDSSEESSEVKGNIVVPASLQFKSWTKDGWQIIEYDLSIDQIYICNYGPTGHFIDEPIYIEGPPCSECPSGFECRNDLCV